MKIRITKLVTFAAILIVFSAGGTAFGQLSGDQSFTVTIGSGLSIVSPAGGNATITHDGTDSNQDFAAQGSDVDWNVFSNSGTGATVAFSNDGLFTNTIGANVYTRNLYFEVAEQSDPADVWSFLGSPNFTSTSGTPTATLQATSTGPGNAVFRVNARFLDTNYSLLPAGSYVMTITGTIAANP